MSGINKTWVDKKLKKLESNGLKIGSIKTFKSSSELEQSSILRIVENISKFVELENITIEPSNKVDIKLIDGELYYLEVKTPIFFENQHGSMFSHVMRDFYKILKESNRFAVGYSIQSQPQFNLVSDKTYNRLRRRASLGILSYFPSSDRYIGRKLETLMNDAFEKFKKVREKAWKIFILDTSFYLARGTDDLFYLLLNILYNDSRLRKYIDGICLFSLNLAHNNKFTLPATIIPVFLKPGINSRVFQQKHQLYSSYLVYLPILKDVKKGCNTLLEVDKSGYCRMDGQEYGHFWNSLQLLRYKMNLLR
ncbi:MAG: hypothetical protein HWN65_21880 [Candidatus Helarchaeota archaeon]|nr:hypothetical protein [Candidatus Helarchaeota archaeon]